MKDNVWLYRLTRNEKYPISKEKSMENPELILISGTLEQAEHVADLLSLSIEVGLKDYYLIDSPIGKEQLEEDLFSVILGKEIFKTAIRIKDFLSSYNPEMANLIEKVKKSH